jgi:hypothetical protein
VTGAEPVLLVSVATAYERIATECERQHLPPAGALTAILELADGTPIQILDWHGVRCLDERDADALAAKARARRDHLRDVEAAAMSGTEPDGVALPANGLVARVMREAALDGVGRRFP